MRSITVVADTYSFDSEGKRIKKTEEFKIEAHWIEVKSDHAEGVNLSAYYGPGFNLGILTTIGGRQIKVDHITSDAPEDVNQASISCHPDERDPR